MRLSKPAWRNLELNEADKQRIFARTKYQK